MCDGCKRKFRLGLALGLTHVRAEDNGRVVIEQILNGGKSGYDPEIISDLSLFHRNVEVTAADDLLGLYVNVFDRFFHKTDTFRTEIILLKKIYTS